MKLRVNLILVVALLVGTTSMTAMAGPQKSSKTNPDAMWTYKQVDGKDFQMSVFLPDDYSSKKSFPTFVIFHGGSWNGGEASWHYPDCEYWSRRGMIAVSVDYRLKDRDNVEVPLECVKDAKSAVRFLRQNAQRLKVDRERIVVAGGSAGGQLAAATAMITSKETDEKSDDASISCKPNAVVLFNPWFKCKPELSPPNSVVSGLPAFITFLGDQDPAIPVKSLKGFHDSLGAAGNESAFYVGKGGKHGFCNGRNAFNPFFYWSLELTDQFLVEQGILSGQSIVKIPAGVKVMQTNDYLAFGGEMKTETSVDRQDTTSQNKFCFLETATETKKKTDYPWTTNHMHVGVRWQPFAGRPDNNAYDAARPIITRNSSYVQFWASWSAIEPTLAHTDYEKNPSASLQAIETAVEACKAEGLKVEFVFFHCPKWASESGNAGGFKPKQGLFQGYVKRIATHFKGRVHAYQLSHEANLEGLMRGADTDFMINDILLKGAQTIREVYAADPAQAVLVSTTGMSPCEGCEARKGLDGRGGRAVNHFYDLMIGNAELMKTVDALNLNVSDHSDGYGNMDGSFVPSVWANYDLVRGKLDAANLRSKSVLSSESWIVWDCAGNAHDVNGDGLKNEQDAYCKAITIIGQCLERGLNTINLPWSDNSSSWAMGLTKRRDYNGRIKSLKPEILIAANDGGADIVAAKLSLRGGDDNFTIGNGGGNNYSDKDYINPPDPNHLHYYIWKWFAQISGGSDEVIRHAMAGDVNNDIAVTGVGFTGNERYRVSSYNRTRNRFTVLVYASGAHGKTPARVSIPSRIQTGYHYNNEFSKTDFRGEGFVDGDIYYARIVTKDISSENGADIEPAYVETDDATVANETLSVTVPNMNKFTAIEFVKRPVEKALPGSK